MLSTQSEGLCFAVPRQVTRNSKTVLFSGVPYSPLGVSLFDVDVKGIGLCCSLFAYGLDFVSVLPLYLNAVPAPAFSAAFRFLWCAPIGVAVHAISDAPDPLPRETYPIQTVMQF